MRPKFKYNNMQTDMLLGMKNIDQRRQKAYDDYLKRREEELLPGAPMPVERFEQIAPIFSEELNIINERYGNVTTFRGAYDAKRDPIYANDTKEMTNTYEKLIKNTNFFEQIVSPKQQTGLTFMNKTIELDTNFTKIRGVSSINKLFQHATAISNIIDGADGYFAAFDMETLSGKNKYGYDDLLGVTEYAFNIHGKGGQYVDTISNVVGVDSARYDKLMERLESLRGQSNKDWSELDRITIGRLNFYNNATIKDVAGEARREITKSASLDGMESTVEGAISGLQKLGKISADQMKVVQEDFQQIAAGMAQNGSVNVKGKSYNIKATTGHNTRTFDIPKFNRAAKLYNANAYADEATLANFDLLQAIKYIYAKNGGNYYGTGEDAPTGKGLMTLEYLKAMYPGIEASDLAAHTAFEDTKTSARMLMAKVDSNKNTTLLQDILSQLGEMRPKSQSSFVGGNKQLYRVDQATSFSNFNRTGAIGFVHDKFSNSFKTFNGYEINGSNVTKSHMTQAGLKSGALYSFDLKSFETGDDFRAAFGNGLDNVISEFNTDRLYVLAGTPVFDTNTDHAIGAMQDIYYVTNSLDPIEGMLNNMQEVGERSAYGSGINLSDIKNYKAKAGISNDKTLALSTVQDGVKKAVSTQTDASLLNEFAQLSTERLTNEYAANYIREMDYDKYKKFTNVIEDITNTYKNELTPNATISQKISLAISKGQSLGGFNNVGGVFDALQFSSFITGKEELLTNSVNRMAWAANNMESLAPIFDQISSMVEQQLPGDDYASKLKRNEAFKSSIRDVLDTVSKGNLLKTAKDIKKAQATAFDSTPTKLLDSDLDYIELTGRQLFGNVGDDNLFRINMGENRLDDNILRKLFNNQFGGRLGADMDGVHGKQALIDFTNRLNKDEQYRGIFNNIDKTKTPKELSADIMTRLNSFVYRRREKDNLFGIVNRDINTQLANIPSKVTGAIGSDIKNVVTNAIKNVQDYVTIDRNGKVNQAAIDKLVQRMISVSANDIEKLDLDPSSKRTLLGNFNLAKADVENVAKDILTAISETDLQLSFNEKENAFGEFLISNKGQNGKKITMPVLRMKNGVLHFDLDTTSHVVRPAINEKMLAKGQIEFTSKLGEITANNGGFTAFVKAAKNKGTDELGAFASAFNSLNQNIREGLPAVQIFNPQAFGMQLEAYTEDITGYLDKFSANGKATGLPGFSGLSSSERKQIENVFKKIEKNNNSRKDLRWSKLSSSERSIFLNKLAMPLFKDRYPDTVHSQTDSEWILKNLMVGGKSTHLTDSGTLSIGRVSPDFMTSFDAQGRDNPTQWGNMYYHRKADIVGKALNDKHLKGKISADPLISDLRKDFTIFNPKNDLGIEMTGMISGKFASMDTGTLRRIVVKAGNVVGDKNPFVSQAKIVLGITDSYEKLSPAMKSKVDNIAAELKEKALHASTYMQETVMYSRLASSVFNKSQRQIINDNKTLDVQFASDVEKIEKLQFNIKDGKFKYGSGFEVEADDILLAQEGYANSRKAYGAKSTGIMKGAFFDKYGNIIAEDEINKALSKGTDYKDVTGYLKSKYDFDYKYHIDAYELKDGVKITLSKTEKSVAYGLQSRLGEFNDEIVNKLTGTRFEKYLGTYVTETLLDEIENSGIKGIKDLALTETHAVGDVLFDKILGKTGAIAITAQDVPKHANVSVAMTAAIGKLRDQGDLTTENISKIMPGAVVRDGSVYVSGSNDFAKNHINGKELEKVLGDSVFTKTRLADYDEDVLTGHGEFTQTIDWQGGTSQGIDTHEKDVKIRDGLISELSSLERQRKQALRNDEDFLSFDIDIAEKSKQLQEIKDKMSTEGYIHRGFAYSDRMHDILGARVLNDEYIGNLQDKNDEIINKAIGDFTENGALREEFKSQQLLSPLTDLYKNNIFEKPGAQKLSEVADDSIKYGDAKKFFTDTNGKITLGDNVSAAWAEKAYTAGSTAEALRFNERVQAGKSVKIEGYGGRYNFQSKSFKDFSPSIGGMLESQLLDKDNSPNFNNTMFDLGEEFGSKRYLAISKPSFANTGDSLTVPDHFAKLSALSSQYETWMRDKTPENKQKIIDTMDGLVNQQKVDFDLLKRDMTKTRLDRSFTAKGGGMVIYRGVHSEMSESAYRNLSSADRLAELKKYNGIKALTDAKFEGKSYLEHYSEGRYLDAVLLPEKAFEDMGYFSDEAIKKYGSRENIVKQLSEKGDVHLIGRFPMIREGSAVGAWAILDKTLVGNEARYLGGSQMAMNLDYDGDTTHVHALQNKNGESYLDYVNSGNKYDDFHSRMRMNILSRSVSENRFYEGQVQEQLEAERKLAINTGNFMEVAKKSITDGERIFANISTPNQENVLNAYNQVKALGLNDEDALSHMEKLEGDDGKIKYAMYKAQEALMIETAAKTQKSVIGESNVINFKGRKLFTTFVDRSIPDYNVKRDMFSDTVDAFEQKVISAKKATDITNLEKAEQWKTAINNIIGNRDVRESRNTLSQLFDENISKDVGEKYTKYVESHASFRESAMTEKEFTEKVKGSFLETLDMFKGNKQVQDIMATTINFGESKHGAGTFIFDNMLSLDTDTSIQGEAVRRLNAAKVLESGRSQATEVLQSTPLKKTLSDSREWLKGESTGQKMKSVLKSTGEVFEKISKGFDGKTLAIGALGLAGAYLVAGFVGGNPSRPADTQAMEDSQSYNIPSLLDQNLQTAQSGSQPGYVVNINAKTSKDKQYASQVINNAVSRNYNTNVNISMNITDDNGNINDRYVEQLLAGAVQ